MAFMIALGFALTAPARAENFATTNVQFLYGGSFHDTYYGYSTPSGDLFTITLEHFDTWNYGDNFFFVDGLFGNHTDFLGKGTGKHAKGYGEWTPRLSLSKLTKRPLQFGPITDVYLAGQFELGEGYRAYLEGLGFDLKAPGFNTLGLNLLRRDDNFNDPTYQVTVYWSKPIRIRSLRLSFEGYVDISGTDRDGTDITSQPQLLLDISRRLHLPEGKCQLGIEWYYHGNRAISSSVPQALLKWKLH